MPVEVEYDPDDAIDDLLALYRTYSWWADRTKTDLRRALRHTDTLVMLRDEDTGTAVAAARVLTDYVYYAMVYDVIVRENRRGEGFGQQLMEAVVDHPKLRGGCEGSRCCRATGWSRFTSPVDLRSPTRKSSIPQDRRNHFAGWCVGVSD